MADVDEISFLLGELKGDIKSIKDQVESHGKKIDRIDTNLTNTRMKVAGIAGTTGLLTGAVAQSIMEWLKIKAGGGNH